MKFPSKGIVERIRTQYPPGTRVELLKMDDCQAPPVGTCGTVTGVDDTASILVRWDNGCGLNVVYGEDICRKLDAVTTICYGKETIWDSRKEAKLFFMTAMEGSEGSEYERYFKIYIELVMGKAVCTDEMEDF